MIQRKRGCGATHCYGCLCDTCANNAELSFCYLTIGETEEPCFNCDDCRHYDGDNRKHDNWKTDCSCYVEAKKAAEAREREFERRAKKEDKRIKSIRTTFKVIEGG